jgi:hypothetical protein
MTLGKGSRVSFAAENKVKEVVNALSYLALAIADCGEDVRLDSELVMSVVKPGTTGWPYGRCALCLP